MELRRVGREVKPNCKCKIEYKIFFCQTKMAFWDGKLEKEKHSKALEIPWVEWSTGVKYLVL